MIKIYSLYVLVTLSIFSSAMTSFQAYGVEEIWEDYENMEDMVKDMEIRMTTKWIMINLRILLFTRMKTRI